MRCVHVKNKRTMRRWSFFTDGRKRKKMKRWSWAPQKMESAFHTVFHRTPFVCLAVCGTICQRLQLQQQAERWWQSPDFRPELPEGRRFIQDEEEKEKEATWLLQGTPPCVYLNQLFFFFFFFNSGRMDVEHRSHTYCTNGELVRNKQSYLRKRS